MKKEKVTFVALLATLAMTTASCKQEQKQEQKLSYSISKVQGKQDKEITLSYSASIEGRQDIDIYPQVSGKIVRMNVKEGDAVYKGQVMFVIDQVPYRAALATATANVKTAKAQLATAKLTYESSQELHKQKVVSDFNLQTSKNAYLTAEAQLAQAKAQEMSARNDLSYTEVKSPSDGVVGMLPYRVGTLVSAKMAQPLTTVSDNSEIYVYFSVPENQLLTYKRQYGMMDKAIKNMPAVKLQLNDGSTYGEDGRIAAVSGVIDKETGAVGLRALFPNRGRLLHSGASGNILIPSTYDDCILVPQEAVVQQQDKYIVYRVVNGKAVQTLITVAPYNDGKEFIVTAGLKPGDEYMSKGAGLVREGTRVK